MTALPKGTDMPYARPTRNARGGYTACAPHERGAFFLPAAVWGDWEARVLTSPSGVVRDTLGRRLRPYPELNVASHAPYAAAGVYVDHRDPNVEAAAYELRDRLGANPGQATLQPLAERGVARPVRRRWRVRRSP